MKKKRIAIFCLAVLMAFSVIAPKPARAADLPTLTVTEETAEPGETVEIDVELSNNPGIYVLEFSLFYDASKLEYIDEESYSSISDTFNESDGRIFFAWESQRIQKKDILVLTLAFRVKEDAQGSAVIGFITDGSRRLYISTDGQNKSDVATVNGGVLLPRTGIFTGVSLSLDSDISLNYYVDLTRDERLKGEMKFFVGEDRSFVADIRYNTKEGRYYCNCPLNVLEMAMDVRAEFTYDGETTKKILSVPTYIKGVMEGDYSAEAKTLAAKIANYGYYAQQYLAAIHPSTVTLGENGYPVMAADPDYPLNVADALAALTDDLTLTDNGANGTSLYGRSVTFDHAMAMNYYLTVESGEEPQVTAPDGKPAAVKLYKGNIFHVSVGDISVTDLNVPVPVTANGVTCSGSPLGCCAAIANKNGADSPAGKAMASLYEYYTAANAYAASLRKEIIV